MRQLTAFDALMVYGETSRTPMHVSPFFIYDQSTAPKGIVRFKDILRMFESKLDKAPTLRQRLMRVPLDLDDPYWVDDPDFDIEHHVRHLALPKPGDRRQLSILLARIHAYPMDLTRPPWDAFVIEGLDNVDGVPKGSFAMLLRIHHASIDGHSGNALLAMIHDLSPLPAPDEAPSQWTPRPLPGKRNLLKRAYFSLLTKPRKVVKVASDIFPAIKRVREVKRQFPGEERHVPKTRFSGNISPHKVLIAVTFDMAGLRGVKAVIPEATVNDAVVTMVTGAMRRYLIAKNDLPEQSMTTIMPVNMRTEAEKDAPGNLVSMAALDMHSTIADPI
jgi:WS/DGAT/MGAT family acyltransferase